VRPRPAFFVNPPILSPCTGICSLDAQGCCEGCYRTGDEIAGWALMDDATRRHLMDVVLPQREARMAG